MTRQIPTHNSDLRISEKTTVEDIVEYTTSRLEEPARLGDTVVWNFGSHDLDARALVNADLPEGEYVVPYQVPGVWGFIVEVLPNGLSEAPLLTYRRDEKSYEVYDNYIGSVDTAAIRAGLEEVKVDV